MRRLYYVQLKEKLRKALINCSKKQSQKRSITFTIHEIEDLYCIWHEQGWKFFLNKLDETKINKENKQ